MNRNKINGAIPTDQIGEIMEMIDGRAARNFWYEKQAEMRAEEQFRYPGPRPQSKETALVMLADSVEAAVKARGKPFENVRDLQLLVNSVVASKIDDDQLVDVDFTMREIAAVKDCFVDVLRSMYHSREVKEIVASKSAKNLQDGANRRVANES